MTSIETSLARGGAIEGEPFGATAPPLYQTATFAQADATRFGEFDYTRTDNPTRRALEEQLAELEGASNALAYSSGMAAIAAVLRLAKPGERVVCGGDLYGGTQRLLAQIAGDCGLVVERVEGTELAEWRRVLGSGAPARLAFVETPTNPLLAITDVAGLGELCRAHGTRLCVDGTATSPYLQRPLELGADVVVHSATKLLSGHGDVTAGVVAVSDKALARELANRRNAEGTALAPFEAWLLQRGLRTLGVRLDRQQQTATELAERLAAHPDVLRVHYPGLPQHPGAALHAEQARGPGQLLSFELRDETAAAHVADATRRFTTAVSFGGLASSLSLPARMSHASVPAERRAAAPLPSGLVRVSIGLESEADLWQDLHQALEGARVSATLGRARAVASR